jgi:hypothetical protein
MKKEMANFGRRLSVADKKKLLGGGPGVGGSGTGSGLRCEQINPCGPVYIPGIIGCCCVCQTKACLIAQQADTSCWYI